MTESAEKKVVKREIPKSILVELSVYDLLFIDDEEAEGTNYSVELNLSIKRALEELGYGA